MKYSFWYKNGLSIVLLTMMIIFLSAQFITGWKDHNDELKEHHQPRLSAA